MSGPVYTPPETDLPPGAVYLLTPSPPLAPRINGPWVSGARPGRPFLFTIPATGLRPMTFRARGLPDGLHLDPQGTITGTVGSAGTFAVVIQAQNQEGTAERLWTLVVGDKLALTPPMGWNSWNCWSHNVTEDHVRASAQALVSSGLVDHGWSSINIDDAWQGRRGGPLNALQPNEKFTDLAALCHDVHRMGLKIGIYSTPWVTTYAGYNGGSADLPDGRWEPIEGWDHYRVNHRVGSFRFEAADARQWAQWGFDYLKYDWNPNDPDCTVAMAQALEASGRDIVFSLSNTAPFEGAEVWKANAQCWRTTGDIRDVWTKADLPAHEQWALGLMDIADQHARWAPHSGPGHWNDADMLVVGQVGWGTLRENHLTPDELYTHFSLWCLWASPLLIGCPVDQLDTFTKNLLTNDEVIAVNQDPLGVQATRVKTGETEVWVKPLEDGSVAVGFLNKGTAKALVHAEAGVLGQASEFRVRDLWRQKDLGTCSGGFGCWVRPHGMILIQVRPA